MIIRDSIINALDEKIKTLKQERKTFKENFDIQQFKEAKRKIDRKLQFLKNDIKQRHNRKFRRDNLTTKDAKKRNRQFSRNKLSEQIKEKRIRRKENYLNKIKELKLNAPDQNAINLSDQSLTDAQKSV